MALTGETVASVAVSDTIDNVRAKLSELRGVPPEHLRLSWCAGAREWRLVIDASRLCVAREIDEAIMDDLQDRFEDWRSGTPFGLNCMFYLLEGVDYENGEPMDIGFQEAADAALEFISEDIAHQTMLRDDPGNPDGAEWGEYDIETLLMRCAAGIYYLADRQAG